MIRDLLHFTDPAGARVLRRLLTASALTAVLEGLAFLLLVPVLAALFSSEPWSVWLPLSGLVAIMLGYATLYQAGTRIGYRYATALLRATQERLGQRIVELPIGWFDADRRGALSRLTTHGSVALASAPAHLVRPVIASYVTPATVLVGLLVLQWQLGLALLLAIPVVGVAFRVTAGLIGRRDVVHDRVSSETASRIIEFAQQQPALRAFGRAGGEGADGTPLRRALADQKASYARTVVVGGAGLMLYGVVIQLVVTAALAVTTALALGGTVGVAEAAALLVLAARFAEPLTVAGALGSGVRMAGNTLTKILDIVRTPVLPEPAVPGRAVVTPGAEIRLEEVTFGYDSGTPVVDGVSFTVPAGTTTAVVGPSGAGKSTLLKLITRFFDVDGGRVRIGGVDVRELGTTAVMDSISQIFQQVYLFEGTLRDNVLTGRPDASDAEVAEVTRLARVDEIAARLPDGWATQVGEGGSRLSGGERQRVSIARALLKDTPIVLVDEATAALDPENEAAVTAVLKSLAGRRTVVVVAHRMATIRHADQIVVLDHHGRVAQIGTHDELVAAGGPYAGFWRERERAGGWRLARA